MKEMELAYGAVERELQREVLDLIAHHGVPQSAGQAHDLADALYPLVTSRRREMWAREATLLRQAHPGIEVPGVSDYPLTALRKLTMNTAGLMPYSKPVNVEMFDPKTQALQRVSTAPYLMPDAEDVQVAMVNRLAAGSSRHIKQASRDLVQRTADHNNVRWARRLSGRENCAFCAMLASRGAVYTRQTVTSTGDGRRYHDHCDCTAVLVPDPKNWDGRQEADELYSMWIQSSSLKTFTQKYREAGEFVGVSA